jgi:hypothetical protein
MYQFLDEQHMYQFLDEQDIFLVEKNPKETGVLENIIQR